jgi:hypothetical protein
MALVQRNSTLLAFKIRSNPVIRRRTTRIIRQTILTGRIPQGMVLLSRGNLRIKKDRLPKIRIQTVQTARIIQRHQVGRTILRPRLILTTRHHQMARIIQLRRAGLIIQILRVDPTIQILQAGRPPRHPLPPTGGRDRIDFCLRASEMGGYANDYFEPPNFIYITNCLINLDIVRPDFFLQPQFQVKR